MLQFISAIPAIISAVSKVSTLFKRGQDVVGEVSGKPSIASNPEELQSEIQSLPLEKQNQWAAIMAKEVDKYAAQNERLAIEIGLVDQNITGNLSREAASEIAIMRMTTRPWTVRWMVYYVLFPFILVVVDLIQHLIVTWLPFLQRWITPFNSFEYVFGVMKWPEKMDGTAMETIAKLFSEQGGPTTFAGELYVESIPWVVSIIVGYMTLREVGKWQGNADKIPSTANMGGASQSSVSMISQTLNDGLSLASNIKSWFKKKK